MRSLVWILSAFVVASCVVSTILWRDLRAERLLAAALQAQLSEPNERQEPAPSSPLAAPVAAVVATATAPAAAATRPASAGPQPTRPSDAAMASRNQKRELWKDPEYRKARLAQMRALLSRSYAGLAEELGISDAEADKLFELMAEQQMNSEWSSAVMIDSSAPEQREIMRRRDEAIAALLGPGRNALWLQYQQNSAERSQARSIGSTLSQAGQPLSGDQLRALTAALVRESQRQEANAPVPNASLGDQVARATESDRRKLAAATPILNAQQLAALSAQIEQQEAMNGALARAEQRAAAAQAQQ